MNNASSSDGMGVGPAGAPKPAAAHFYRAVWRWHFYAGLFVVPFMAMLSLTGIIYLFKPQLDWLRYRDRMYIAPESTPAVRAQKRLG